MMDAMQARYYHSNLRKYIDNFTCGICQQHKLSGGQYGLLPERDVRTHPGQEVAVDLIGPWAVEIRDKWYEFNALTCIDMVTNLAELIRVDIKISAHIRSKFEQSWSARYSLPKRCIHDNDGEFNGHVCVSWSPVAPKLPLKRPTQGADSGTWIAAQEMRWLVLRRGTDLAAR